MTFYEQDPPSRLYLSVIALRVDDKSHILRSKPYSKLSTARMRLSTLRAEHGDTYRDGWIETCSPEWARVGRQNETGKRRRCAVCRKLNTSVFEREVPEQDRCELSCADCFDRLMDSIAELTS